MLILSRRRLLRLGAAAAAAGTATALYTWRVEPHRLELVHRVLPLRNLPPGLAGRTLVQLSDIHIGRQVDDDYVVDTFRRIAALRPDIVVFTGDFVSHHAEVFDQLSSVFRHAPHGRIATLGILGNHDYGLGWRRPEVAAVIVERLAALGVTVLRNQTREIEGLQILGLDDLWAHRFSAQPSLRDLDPRKAHLVLTHNPDTVDLPVWGGYRGWILAGHTHGGQCKPPFLPPPLLPVNNRRYTAGEFELSGDRRLYISRGVGHLLRVRFNVRPEATLFELQPA